MPRHHWTDEVATPPYHRRRRKVPVPAAQQQRTTGRSSKGARDGLGSARRTVWLGTKWMTRTLLPFILQMTYAANIEEIIGPFLPVSFPTHTELGT